ncbi:probable LRR receptor-like serine/threonine-protein kinase At3g47570 [Papaver somniferum]|uniref:probable LRR receptor-like serine/threonine-protein kinase At3g47570 n=1 Tax=Papaver somniferum TaxID=3469 RepID=UPI000E6FFBCD|nr:probable LRR receptor-like serine/threonine-protein kinase At3g47570 [Papaver somniferum]
MEVNKCRRLLLVIYVTLVVFTMALLPTSRSAITFGNQTDRLSLVAFKERVTGDPFGTLSSWNDSFHHCSWIGITCSRRHPGRVTVLNLVSQSLVGSISPDIGNLTFLKLFALSNNSFNGKIPQEIGHLRRLRFIFSSNNSLTGEIPNNLTSCTELRVFFAERNELVGRRIPIQLGSLSKLVILEISANYLEGTIPVSLSNISTLATLSLASNNLSGNRYWQFLGIMANDFAGPLPNSIANLSTKLTKLYVGMNPISGEIPTGIDNLVSLNGLDMEDNLLTGSIPVSIGNLPNLVGNFRKDFPPSLVRKSIIWYDSKLSGEMSLFRNPSSARYLNLSSNNFEGEVPKHGIFKNAIIFAIFLGLSFIIFWRRKLAKTLHSSESPSDGNDLFQKVSYKELLKATNEFSAENLVGVGSYGSVYKGLLMLGQETTTIVALKVVDLNRRGASKSFTAECEALRCIRHRNLVKIYTSCSSVDFRGNEFKALVFEFMPNGSLENWLHPTTAID